MKGPIIYIFVIQFSEAEHRPNKTPSPRMGLMHNMFEVSDRLITDNSLNTFTGHTNEVLSATFSGNGAQIVSCGQDNTARVRVLSVSYLNYPINYDKKTCFLYIYILEGFFLIPFSFLYHNRFG